LRRYTALDNFLVTTRSEVEMKAAIARRLEYILDVFEGGRIPLEKLFSTKKRVAVDLSKLRLYEDKVLVALFILASLYNYLFERGEAKRPERLLVIDEAQNIIYWTYQSPSLRMVHYVQLITALHG
jgi:hypothetical protein